MDYHRYSGYALLGVLVFRVYWGFLGSSTARFAQFVKGPRTVWRYLRTQLQLSTSPSAAASPSQISEPSAYSLLPSARTSIGHNPLGALSVLALLILLLTQVSLGLFTVDVDGLESGPLSSWISFEMGRACAKAHAVVFNILLALIALHVAAVLFYWIVKRDNLIGPMITGCKAWIHQHQPTPAISFAPWWLALLGIALAASVVWSVV
jgi:cytochrome b